MNRLLEDDGSAQEDMEICDAEKRVVVSSVLGESSAQQQHTMDRGVN